MTGLTTALGAAYGGTGHVNNASNTITFSGNYGLTLTLSNTTSVTLPTSGTLATTAIDTITVTYTPSTPSTGGVVVSGCTLSGMEIN